MKKANVANYERYFLPASGLELYQAINEFEALTTTLPYK